MSTKIARLRLLPHVVIVSQIQRVEGSITVVLPIRWSCSYRIIIRCTLFSGKSCNSVELLKVANHGHQPRFKVSDTHVRGVEFSNLLGCFSLHWVIQMISPFAQTGCGQSEASQRAQGGRCIALLGPGTWIEFLYFLVPKTWSYQNPPVPMAPPDVHSGFRIPFSHPRIAPFAPFLRFNVMPRI